MATTGFAFFRVSFVALRILRKTIIILLIAMSFEVHSQSFDELLASGDYNKAEAFIKSSDSGKWKLQKSKAIYLTNAGALYLNKGRQDLALEKLQEAYNIFQQTNADRTKDAARTLSWLSLTYNASGKYNQAQTNGLIALQLRQELFGEQSEAVAASYNDLGLVYSQTDADQALEYYEKALESYKRLNGNDNPKIAIANTNIGVLYTQIELYGDAINNLESASKIWLRLYPNGHPNVGFVYRSLGQTYMNMGNNTLALTYFEKALAEYGKAFGEKHPDIASTWNQIAAIHLNQHQYNIALSDLQHAIYANSPSLKLDQMHFSSDPPLSTNAPLNDYYNANVLLYTLVLRAQTYETRHFGKTLKLADLGTSLYNLFRCDSLIDDIRHHRSDESDKLSLGALANDVYEDGVRVASAMSEITASPRKYREIAFYFAEKSKSAVLQESIADAQAKSFAGLPQELVDEEKDIRSGIAFLSQRLSAGVPAEEEKYLRESLFTLNNEYEVFTKKIEKSYPNYFNLKYNNAFPTVRQLQAMLESDDAIVSYFIAEKAGRLFQFVITSKSFKSYESTLPADFEKLAKGMNNSIYFRDFATYAKTAGPLSKLLRPNVPGKIKNITIIPSGRLSTMPLEALPSKKTGDSFTNTKYLVQQFAISYEFSAGLIAQKQKGPSKNNQPSVFLCAPVTFPAKDNLNALPGSEAEVNAISDLFGALSQVVKFKDANEAKVKSDDIAKYNYLHFATHGVVDETDPELSRIFLNENPSDDGHLFAGEIYNLSLNADLAVLSACQTGLGKYSKGEGVIGLSRALVYAGAKNLVVSFWSVADESTSIMMKDFYSILLKNQDKGFQYALQQSKIGLIKSGKFSEPYYWAPFVLIGF